MGSVVKDFYKSDAPQFQGKSKEKRREMAVAAKLTAERGPQNESATEKPMSPAELSLQKRKALIDKQITMRRQQALNKQGMDKKQEMDKKTVKEGDGDPCWDTHKQVGMKKKGNRMVPNCVPKNKVKESTEDSLRDRRMERGGLGGNIDYSRPPAAPNLAGKKKPKRDGPSAMDVVKSQIRAKYGDKSIMDTKKK